MLSIVQRNLRRKFPSVQMRPYENILWKTHDSYVWKFYTLTSKYMDMLNWSVYTISNMICQALGNLRTFRHVTFITALWNGDSVLYQKSLGTEESSGNFRRRAPQRRLGWARTGQSSAKLLSSFCSTNQKRPPGPNSQSGAALTQAPIYTAAQPASTSVTQKIPQ